MSSPSPSSIPPGSRAVLRVGDRSYAYYRLDAAGATDLATPAVHGQGPARERAAPRGRRRRARHRPMTSARWPPGTHRLLGRSSSRSCRARVILQDFTGVPCVVDLAAMRDAVAAMGGDPSRINPLVAGRPGDRPQRAGRPVRLRSRPSLSNVEREYERNGERYALLRWAQQAFDNFRVVPPGTGIVHQVNLEFLADVVTARPGPDGELVAFPDTLVGTDSHTTMINGLGVVGWGVGGIEAEAALLGQPLYQPMPVVVGFRLDGELRAGRHGHRPGADRDRDAAQRTAWSASSSSSTAPGLSRLGLADRATISNMSPEFGATATLFPIDDETLRYLRMTGRPTETVDRASRPTPRSRACSGPMPPPSRASTSRSAWTWQRGAVRGRTAPAAGSRGAHRP